MNSRSKAIAPNTTAYVPTNVNAPHTPAEPTREEAIPSWARALLENVQATDINVQAISIKLDQLDIRL